MKLVISCVLLGIAVIGVSTLSNFGFADALAAAREMSLGVLALVFAALLANALFASLRFKIIAADTGHPIGFWQAVAAVSGGNLAGTLFFQLAGQLTARAMMMSRGGIPFASVVVMTAYERAIAAIISALLAAGGAYFLFGKIAIDEQSGGGDLIKIIAGLLAATIGGALLGYGRMATRAAAPFMTGSFILRLLRATVLSLLVQMPMMAAYVIAAHALSPATPIADLAAASAIVMFAASPDFSHH